MHGGLGLLSVTDNGTGMPPEDLELCWHTHATSKIHTEHDLDTVGTMGFRGEALASIAAVARLEIETAFCGEGSRLVVEAGEQQVLQAHPRGSGTMVRVSRLFHQLPGRRNFLRSERAEAAAVRREVQNRALGFPEVAFTLLTLPTDAPPDGGSPRSGLAASTGSADPRARTSLTLPAVGSIAERFSAVMGPAVQARLLQEITGDYGAFRIRLALGEPGLFRGDRGGIRICVNHRPVTDFRFVQAIEYGYTGLMPNGRHPIALVMLDADPGLVDPNVHPAKREVKLRRASDMHHAVVELVQRWASDHLGASATVQPAITAKQPGWWAAESSGLAPATGPKPALAPAGRAELPGGPEREPHREQVRDTASNDGQVTATTPTARPAPGARLLYRGPLFNEFLLAQDDSALYVVDFHAAHERQLYRAFLATGTSQHLLIPLPFLVDPAVDLRLAERQGELGRAGIGVRRRAPGEWELIGVPLLFSGNAQTLLAELEQLPGGTLPLAQALFANRACRAALKAGDLPDPDAAQAILDSLGDDPDPRCPHGRPVFRRFSRSELRAAVSRD